ncbi:MAG: type II toxin-antitoxin system HipA family toxin [gamma proteobacterium symbiont of Bathyaustriella thionipta]|nr:type II toxin-antitoxin system HipA family toxin [gamma proteobacterium symbiont of Bathyaustriella thionipta]MCU7949003.1 type II toxin-antitoxin system HipA family toxin [gamma proteobacterium symbiont of Bathyaustriella thionipta]MCU7952203.1 type II toxin-antitoxin system HipA family toxin [gamma proteobacterium symbiont of Bathyaustriella thionipta]MCU7955587.1 type II toxin-antitoxin system HipA family toxin [gamma proteobacterium symbiont of Bathyaustriella thionipta]MCU7967734.1 type
MDEISVLKLTLHNRLVGYLAGFQNGRNVLSFADEFKHAPSRPTFSLITHPSFPNSKKLMSKPWAKSMRLHPVLSNLLPEGALRELISQGLKTHIDNEFQIFSYLGQDLPGALVATPMEPEDVPESVLTTHGQAKAIKFEDNDRENKFSLAGIQMKFSMKEKGGRYNLTKNGELGDWIIKTPSTKHKHVPLNEYTAMHLAALAGVDIPDIKLIEINKLDNLPQINLPDEKLAFAIKRFDREGNTRIHMEDFAQVLVKYPHEKYKSANYEQVGKVIYDFSGDGLADAQQFARRLLVNILLANGDAHLKNWSLLYQDQVTPRLSPAYDIVTTSVYIDDEKEYALNLGKMKKWYSVTEANFQYWADKSGIPWRAIRPHIDDTMDKVRTLWPEALKDLPMDNEHKGKLKDHWLKLQSAFKIKT